MAALRALAAMGVAAAFSVSPRKAGLKKMRVLSSPKAAATTVALEEAPLLVVLQEEDSFEWTKQWYPIAAVEYLDPTRPHPFTLMGRDVVIWNDGPTISKKKQVGDWCVFDDACPHRLAPLSEGRVEATGELLCAYHAWRFDGEGQCTAIPQAVDDVARNPKAQCQAMPTRVEDGLLWVWPETGKDAALESLLRNPALVPELHDASLADRVKLLPWNVRDLPYSWDYFMENVMDPSHVVVSHHGITGNRYTDPSPISFKTLRHPTTQQGFKFEVVQNSSMADAESTNDFRPPALQQITTNFKGGGKMILCLYAVPTRPGECRHVGAQVLVKGEDGKYPPGIGAFATPMPIWLLHILASTFLHQDALFLHHQEKTLAQRGYEALPGRNYLDAGIFTPTEADKNVITFRNWLRTRANGGVPWPAHLDKFDVARAGGNTAVFDVYDSHTKNCQYCLAAVKNIKRLRVAAFVSSVVCVLFRPHLGVARATLGAAVTAGFGLGLGKLKKLFYSYEFSHADNN